MRSIVFLTPPLHSFLSFSFLSFPPSLFTIFYSYPRPSVQIDRSSLTRNKRTLLKCLRYIEGMYQEKNMLRGLDSWHCESSLREQQQHRDTRHATRILYFSRQRERRPYSHLGFPLIGRYSSLE